MELVADANVPLSALIGGRARLIIAHPEVTKIVTSENTFALPSCLQHLRLHARVAPDAGWADETSVHGITPELKPWRLQNSAFPAAEQACRIRMSDPHDVDILALALHLRLPLWSNDKDFSGTGVEWDTTEFLLRRLGLI